MLVGKYMSSFIIDPLPLELPELRKEEPRRECKGGRLKKRQNKKRKRRKRRNSGRRRAERKQEARREFSLGTCNIWGH